MGTDSDWEKWGQDDPYYGVLSDEAFRAGKLNDEARARFFASGESHVIALLEKIRARFEPGFQPGRSLDFGCGVGRILLPLARYSREATGLDIAPSMLAEARRNSEAFGLGNIGLVLSDDGLGALEGQFNLVHSHIVFAHIHPTRGMALIDALAQRVAEGGYLAVQVLYACNAPRWVRALVKLRYQVPLVNMMRNLVRGRPLLEPPMQLHVYDLPALVQTLARRGFGDVLLVTDKFPDGVFESVVVLARRAASA